MKKLMSVFLAVALAAGFVACGGQPVDQSAAPASQPQPESVAPQPEPEPEPAPVEPVGGLQGQLQGFAAKTAGAVLPPGENGCYSPASLYLALALATAGAEAETQAELLALLGSEDAAALHAGAAQLMQSLPYVEPTQQELMGEAPEAGEEARPSQLSVANAAWLNSLVGSAFTPEFAAIAEDDYTALLETLAFGTPEADTAVNDWIKENTGGKIDAGFQSDPAGGALLANTVYYNDSWLSEFSPEQNTTEPFTGMDGQEQDCEYMNKTVSDHYYFKGAGYIGASLSLGNASMTFVLPDEGVDPASLLADPALAAGLMGDPGSMAAEVIFQVPKFSFDTKIEPKEALQSLGVSLPFDSERARFGQLYQPLVAGEGAYISDIIQQTFIDVNEEGVEAAAATMVLMDPTAAPIGEEPPVIELRLTRPFIFVLERGCSLDGAYGQVPLFIGLVYDAPAAQA